MTSDRPYRGAMSPDEAISELKRSAGTRFDPEAVRVFFALYEEAGGLVTPVAAELDTAHARRRAWSR